MSDFNEFMGERLRIALEELAELRQFAEDVRVAIASVHFSNQTDAESDIDNSLKELERKRDANLKSSASQS